MAISDGRDKRRTRLITQGIIQTTRTNDYGFTSYKIANTWYGADAKGPPRASEGEKVSFEAFEKAGKDGRTWPTIKIATFKKVPQTSADDNVGRLVPGVQERTPNRTASVSTQRDTYWSDKAAEDKLREPRIVYQSAYERAVQFVDLAVRAGAFKALEKAKETAKLEILEAFVDEQTDKIMRAAFAAIPPALKPVNKGSDAEQPELESDPEESWS